MERLPGPPNASDTLLELVAPGLIWLATLFSLLVLVQRSFAIEGEDGALDALRVAGVDAGALFAGKALALAAQLAVLEALASRKITRQTLSSKADRTRPPSTGPSAVVNAEDAAHMPIAFPRY